MNAWVGTLAQSAAGHAINAGVAGTVLAGLLWAALRAFGKQSSRVRFAVWFVGLLAIAALPFVSAQRLGSQGAVGMIALPSAWAGYLVALWGLGAGLGIVRLGIGLARVRHLRRHATEIDPATLAPTTVEKLKGAWRRVRLYRSEEVSVPMVVGFTRPAILLPSRLAPQLSREELDVIVLHEMAHVRRCDDWTNLVQKLVKTVFFFHPAVWWIDNRLALEREMACDEIVLEQSPSAKAYAGFLISFHEKLQSAGAPMLVQALVSRVSQLSTRVTQILDNRKTVGKSRMLVFAAGAALAATLGGVAMVPDVVSFRTAPAVAVNSGHGKHVSTVHGYENLETTADVVQQPKVVNAAYHSTAAAVAPVAKAKPARKNLTVPSKAIAKQVTMSQRTLVVYRAAEFDGANWTICIWSVDPTTNTMVQSFVLKI